MGLDHVRHRTYQGTAEVLFTPQGTSGTSASPDLSPADVATDIELIQSAPVQAAVAKTLHTTAPPVTATEVGTTNVAQIAVQSTSPDFASAAANAYARAYLQVATQGYINSQHAAEKQIQTQKLAQQTQATTILHTPGFPTSAYASSELQRSRSRGSPPPNRQVYQLEQNTEGASAGQLVVPAVPDPVPISPKPVRDAVIAIGVGLLLGIGFALLRENLDDRVRGKDQLEQLMPGIPVLGLIPVIDEWRDRKRPYLVAQVTPEVAALGGLPGTPNLRPVHGVGDSHQSPTDHQPLCGRRQDHHVGQSGLDHGRRRPAGRVDRLRPASTSNP